MSFFTLLYAGAHPPILLSAEIDFTRPFQDPVVVFCLMLFIILLAPILFVRVKAPGIIGLVIAGIIVGPHGFNLLELNSAVELFSTIGLLYIMFLAGLELDLQEFQKHRGRSLLFGTLTFFIPLLLGLPLCYYVLGIGWKGAVLTASMFSTHTLLAYPIVSRMGVAKNEAVAVTVGGTILTDTAVLLILAIIAGSVGGDLTPVFWLQLLISVAIFTALVLFLFPVLSRWFFRNMRGQASNQFIFVLAMVFLAAFMAKLAGVEPIIGSFLAGLALNPLIPHSSPLMNRVEFFGNALFIPIFLLSVGMLIDVKILLAGPLALMVAFALTAMALLSKWLAAFVTQQAAGYSSVQRRIIFGLSSAHAAATIAVILVGFNLGLIDENVLNGTIILILVTALVSSFVTQNAGRELALEADAKLPISDEPLNKILVPIANPATIESLLDLAIYIKDPRSKAPISALAIVQDNEEAEAKLRTSRRMLESAVNHAAATETTIEVITRIDLNPASGIANAARELMAGVIVIGWQSKTTPGRFIFGTTLDKLLEQSWQTIIVSHLIQPLNIFRRLLLIVPPNAEKEKGFHVWAGAARRLGAQLGGKIELFSDEAAAEAFREHSRSSGDAFTHHRHDPEDWEDLLLLSRNYKNSDLLVVISARSGTLSFFGALNQAPRRLGRHYSDHSFLIIYPEQNHPPEASTYFDEVFIPR